MAPKTLYPAQQQAHDFFLQVLRSGASTLDSSEVGTGKTVVAGALAAALGGPVAVVSPKAVLVSWQRELAAWGVEPEFVLNYEALRGGRKRWLTKKHKHQFQWVLPQGTTLFWDEVHYCKSPKSQNGSMLIAAAQQGFRNHCMSATAAEDPTEMKALGYVLGLHSLAAARPPLQSWFGWCRANGCYQDQWRQWVFGGGAGAKQKLAGIQQVLYTTRAHRLRVADFPASFRANRVFVEPVVLDGLPAIRAAYAEAGVTPEIIEAFVAKGTVEDSAWCLTNMLRARQLAEACKVPYFAEQALALQAEGYAVVLFVNFRASADALAAALGGAPKIEGGQTTQERQRVIDDFQADRTPFLVANTAAGGVGVSLHDLHGKHPRAALISPSFNAKEYAQVLGRIHRNGAATDALQRVLVAADTIEEDVVRALHQKLEHLNLLHNPTHD